MPSKNRFLIAITNLENGEQQSGYYDSFLVIGGESDYDGNPTGRIGHTMSCETDDKLELLRRHANSMIDMGHQMNADMDKRTNVLSELDVDAMMLLLKALDQQGAIKLSDMNVTPDCNCVKCQALVKLKGAN